MLFISILITEGSTPSCRPNLRDLGATGVRILMRVGMSFSVSFSCAWFAIMNLHISGMECVGGRQLLFPYLSKYHAIIMAGAVTQK